MKVLVSTAICFFVFVVITLESCSHYDEIMKNGKESSSNGNSHNAGKNCMSCHHDSKNEASENWWYFAGTVYNGNSTASSSGFIELWTDVNRTGELLYKVPVDKSGNFYTSKIFSFKGGFYPVLVKNDNTIKAMTTKTSEGSCSSCHGVSQDKIQLN